MRVRQGIACANEHVLGGRQLMKLFFQICLMTMALTMVGAANSITNGGFEAGLAGWRPLWTRETNTGTVTLDTHTVHGGQCAARVDHPAGLDWSLEPAGRLAVSPGEIFELAAWVKLNSQGGLVTLCVSSYAGSGQVMDWSYGESTLKDSADWQRVRTQFMVPSGVVEIQPRVIGSGPATVWLDDFSLRKTGQVTLHPPASLPTQFALTNPVLEVSLNTSNATLSVRDRRTGQRFDQSPLADDLVLTRATASHDQLQLRLLRATTGQKLTAWIRLEPAVAEFTVEVSGPGSLTAGLAFPHPFLSHPGEYLVVPMNEGISYPVEDRSIDPFKLIAYGGHGICMAFWGVTDGERGHMAILETPDDASIRIERQDGLLGIAPQWDGQRGQFGYARRLRYVFFDHGGHVAMAKRYRVYAQSIGRFKTLEQKRRENPNVDLLVGAVNVWCHEPDAAGLVKDLQAAGIQHILWSSALPPEQLRALNELGVLTSRYDIYQDVMNPANFPQLAARHGDWVTEAWPAEIIRQANGEWERGWGVPGRAGDWFYCGLLCDEFAPGYAARRITAELATHPYRCRFIDTTTAMPWQECYDPHHPMTRTDSRKWKMKLLNYISADARLVAGSETGHDAAVPFVHYFEGMLSLGPYRVPDAGRNTARIWTNAPERVVKFQLGQQYRLPLWELVYHECVVAQWYWGDYNNKLPMLWDKRDLFNILYATPPMFMFDRALWERNSARFARSYQNICPLVRRVGYSEMTDHCFLTPDRSVQQTTFANGVHVTVNFGPAAFRSPDGSVVGAMGFLVR